MNRPSRGFTLIELLVVLALISIMLALAVPSFTSFISNYRATSAVNEILQGITTTRAEALKRGRRVTMAPISGDWRNGWTVFIDGTTPNQVYDSGEILIFRHDALPTSTSVAAAGTASTPFNGNFVLFDGTGYPRNATGATIGTGVGITLTDRMGTSSNVRTLCLAPFGRPRIFKGIDACLNP